MQQKKTSLILFSAVLFLLSLSWLLYLPPQPHDIRIIHPSLRTTDDAAFTVHSGNQEGLYWMNFTLPGKVVSLDHLLLRTVNCVHSVIVDNKDWNVPEGRTLCNNGKGLLYSGLATQLHKKTEWSIAGSTEGGNYGLMVDVDWKEWPLSLGLLVLTLSFASLLFLLLPVLSIPERAGAVLLLCVALAIRFYTVFIVSPPQLHIYSDMGAYLQRSWEIDHGVFHVNHLFQPVGFTLWSLGLRKLGGFELFNWSQVFLSWGTVFLIYLIARKQFGRAAGLFALVLSTVHIPNIGMAGLHMAETAYAFLITFSLWLLLRIFAADKYRDYFTLGFILSLAFYFKGNHAFFIPVFAVWVLYRNRSHWFTGMKKVGVMALGAALITAAHTIWTGLYYDKPYTGPTAGALNFVEGKCPSKDNRDPTGSRWMSPLFGVTGETTFKQWPVPFTDQAYFWKAGFKCVQAEPAVLVTSLRYIYYLFWGNPLWPVTTTPVRDWFFTWEKFFHYVLIPLSALGALAYARKKDPLTDVMALMMLTLFFTVWFFKSENRFRAPFDTILLLWSAGAFAWALAKVRAWRERFNIFYSSTLQNVSSSRDERALESSDTYTTAFSVQNHESLQ